MQAAGVCLGICYADNQLFYSVNNPDTGRALQHIGSFDFNFDVADAIANGEGDSFLGIKSSLENLKQKFSCNSVRILSPAVEECWNVLPRSVYEDSAEREAHIKLLMHGVERSLIETTWYPLSNIDYRLLLLRKTSTMQGFKNLIGSFSHTEYVAEFEIGNEWQNHTKVSGSYLAIHCHRDYISISSHILGKLRGATVIRFENRSDLPYLWALYGSKLSWMKGLHEQIYVYGEFAREATEALHPFWDDSGEVIIMNSLNAMNVVADEQTYGFRLESAFPAVMMSLNYEQEPEEEL